MSDDQRAEAAFRRAFADVVASSPVPETNLSETPSVAGRKRGVRRRRRWLAPVAAAAAVALAAGGTAFFLAESSSSPTPDAAFPPPEDGWRYEWTGDVVVQVPETWGRRSAPGSGWCAEGAADRFEGLDLPYVTPTAPGSDIEPLIGCGVADDPVFGNVPEHLWSTYLSLAPAGAAELESEVRSGEWSRISRRVGAVDLTVTTDAEHRAVAEEILASAEQVTHDPLGCPVQHPVQTGDFQRPQEPFPLAEVTHLDEAVVCQYAVVHGGGGPGRPGLVASHRLDDDVADAWVAAVRQAPEGEGPGKASNCLPESASSALVVRARSGDRTGEVTVHASTCQGNGVDDGVVKRQLTRDNCHPLWNERVQLRSADMAVARICPMGPAE